MKRDVTTLIKEPLDLLVIGGGILGACVLRDAALRGLRAALVERDDFAAGTSANSLKVIHGGLRYLQQLNLRRVRESSVERSTWLRIAPHLVEPLPVLAPTFRSGLDRRGLFRAACAVNDLVSWDRNRGAFPERYLPPGRILSRRDVLALAPELVTTDLTGGALFYDAQMYSAERLALEVVLAAVEGGAIAANHVEVEGPLLAGDRLVGVVARDRLRDDRFDVRASIIVNTAGPATSEMTGRLLGRPSARALRHSLALNLVIPGLGHTVAFSIGARSNQHRRSRKLFVVPWRGLTMIGTAHYPFDGDPTQLAVPERDVERFLGEVNAAWPGKPLARQDVLLLHAGLVPDASAIGGEPALFQRHRITDHAADGSPSLISGVSAKYTTARLAAEEIVNLAFRKLGRQAPACRTATTLLPGAPTVPVGELTAAAVRRLGGQLEPTVLEHLVRSYGSRYGQVLAYQRTTEDWNERVPGSSSVIRAQFLYGADKEMAELPEDLVCRRTEIHATGTASDAALDYAGQVLHARVNR